MASKDQLPSGLYTRLFERFCKEELYEELQGDLHEEFKLNLKVHGRKRANRIYKLEVLKMIRPSILKATSSKKHPLTPTIMFKNYSVVALRNISRNKLFSAINIVGLAISMAVGLVAITFVSEIYSYDNFHQNGKNIYRVVSDITRPSRGTSYYATAPLLAAKKLQEDFAGPEVIVPIDRGFNGDIAQAGIQHKARGIHTTESFFDVFSFPLLHGNKQTALDNPYSVILTEALALRIFGRTDVVGEVIEHSRFNQLTVTGVVQNPPHNSHLQFDVIGSIETLKVIKSRLLTRWGQSTAGYVYVLIPDGQGTDNMTSNLKQLAQQENAKTSTISMSFKLEPLNDIFPGDGRYNQFGTVMPQKNVNSIIILTLIVILSACFNYTNLSMARSLKRSKEVGVRKVIGASKGQLFTQFILEAILISLLALLISTVLFRLIRPEFLSLNFYIERTSTLALSTKTYLIFFLFASLVGTLSGFLPALLMSKLKPATIIKGASTIKASKGIDFRKILITAQFTLSMGFLILVTLTYKQYKYALNFDLGFKTENILNVRIAGNDLELLKNTFEAIPEVKGLSSASMVASTGSYQSFSVKLDNPLDSVDINAIDVSPGYIENMNHSLVAGSGFKEGMPPQQIILNELAVKSFGITNPQDAINQTVSFSRKKWNIIGVVKTFHDRSMDKPLAPFMFTSGYNRHYHLNLNIETADVISTMTKLESAWASIDRNSPFEATFYSDHIQRTYSDISASIKTYGLLAAIAISISILGLLGMAVYTTETKIKELAIRKVLGANVSSLVSLLSRNFILIFLVSAAIAIPLAYSLYNKIIVPEMVYKVDVGFWELSGGALLIIIIAFLTISSQTYRAAKSSPAESLRND